MGLSSALASAMSGLRANQAALSIVSSNVANAQTPAYVDQTANQIEVTTGDFGSTAQTVALGAAQALATQLNVTTKGIQSLRSNVEQDLGTSAQAANAAMQQVAT